MVRLPTCTLSPPLPPPHNVDHQLRSFMGNDVSSTLERGGEGEGLWMRIVHILNPKCNPTPIARFQNG